MKAPAFWDKNGIKPKLLAPAACVYSLVTQQRMKNIGYKSKLPVICVGNLVAGGAGKTPTAIKLGKMIQTSGKKINFLASGYNGKINIVAKVVENDPHKYGDEAVVLSAVAPTWIGKDRAEAAQLAEMDGAEVLVLDDGYQNPTLQKDFSVVVVDAEYGFGNGKVIPAGPLRETVEDGLARADAILIIGDGKPSLPKTKIPIFKAKVEISFPEVLKEERIVPFCGLARPEKFFNSLKKAGLDLADEISFPDHHPYLESDIKAVLGIASKFGAVVVTTEKDFVKLPQKIKMLVHIVKMDLVIENEDKLKTLMFKKIK